MSLLVGVLRAFDLDILVYTFYQLYMYVIRAGDYYYSADAYLASDPELASPSAAASPSSTLR